MTDVRALLLTDLVDSTALVEGLGVDGAAALGARHDRLARALLARHGGREIDKTDGFLLLFSEPRAAVRFAVAYHEALAAEGLRARAGLHVGEVSLRENDAADVALGAKPLEVDGLAKAVAARVMSIAPGGRTLATASALEALGDAVTRVAPGGEAPSGAVAATSQGHWQLKGVRAPVELFEVGPAGALAPAPPPDAAKAWRVVRVGQGWAPANAAPHHLPAERDSFVGRDADLRDLARRLDEGARLVSVLGVGGTGKTRLVTRFAWSLLGAWSGGAWFCDLSEARDLDAILSVVAGALGVQLGAVDPVGQLGHAIAARGPCLIVLDNFEQVARLAPDSLGRWLDRAAEARFLVTSREVLGLPGEVVLALAPLRDPDGVELFEERARQANRSFAPSAGERAEIEALVRLLDGLPLAIELAAARVRVMSIRALRERMRERFRLLTSSGGRQTRQSTLRATLDWSWDLLTAPERSALAQLSVFEGGFDLEAAEAVVALEDAWVVDVVQALVDRSLLRRVTDDRFDLLVTVQEYAAERLDAQGGRADAEARHGRWFASRFPDGGEAAGSAAELDNLRVASTRASRRGDGPVVMATTAAAWAHLQAAGPYESGVQLLTAAALTADLGPADRATLDLRLANACRMAGRLAEATAAAEGARATFDALGDRRGMGRSRGVLGVIAFEAADRDRARAALGEALELAVAEGDVEGEALAALNLGIVDHQQARHAEARVWLERALARYREGPQARSVATALQHLGNVADDQARHADARAHYEEALGVARALGDRMCEANVLSELAIHARNVGDPNLSLRLVGEALALQRAAGARRAVGLSLGTRAFVLAELGRLPEAVEACREAIAVHREVGNRVFEAIAMGNLGNALLMVGDLAGAAEALEGALALHLALGNRRSAAIVQLNLGRLHQLGGDLAQAALRLGQAEAVARDLGDRRMLAAALATLAAVRHAGGELADALALLSEAEDLARQAGDAYGVVGVLVVRAEVRADGGDEPGARADWAEARERAEALRLGADAEPVVRLRKLSARWGEG